MKISSPPWTLRGPIVTGLLAIIFLIGGFGSWAVTAQLSGAIIAQGHVIAARHPQIVQHPDGGIVAKVYVENGDHVQPRDRLLTLNDPGLTADLSQAEAQHFDLLARLARLRAEHSGHTQIAFPQNLISRAASDPVVQQRMVIEQNLATARNERHLTEQAQHQARVRQLSDQITGLQAQLRAATRQSDLIERQLQDQVRLQDLGLTQTSRVAALQREQARLIGAQEDIGAQMRQTENRLTEIKVEGRRIAAQTKEDLLNQLLETEHQAKALRHRIEAMQTRQKALTLTAPIAGTIHQLSAHGVSSVLQPGQPILQIVPANDETLIRVQVQPAQIDQLSLGQSVDIRLLRQSQTNAPILLGEITFISADRLVDEPSTQAYFDVEITVPTDEIAGLKGQTPLSPGTPVQAFIRTRDRTPLSYLIQPFTDYLAQSMREG